MINIIDFEIGIATGISIFSTIFNIALAWIAANLLVVLAFAIVVLTPTNCFIAQSRAKYLVQISK